MGTAQWVPDAMGSAGAKQKKHIVILLYKKKSIQ
jgi:hypothetical protein